MADTALNEQLVAVCKRALPDLFEIRELIIAGADVNQLNQYGENIFEDAFLDVLYHVRNHSEKLPPTVAQIKEILQLMVEHGWDIQKYGLSTMDQFKFSTYDYFTFDLYRYMLQFDLAADPQAYEDVLEGVGTEESYQRCCEHDHDLENLFFALYELIEAKKEGKDFTCIEPYYGAVGLPIDKVLYFGDPNTLVNIGDSVEYNNDIGFVCGNKLLILCESVNILFMNGRIDETPQIDISSMFTNVLGKSIKTVSFDHNDVVKGKTSYGQPTIIIEVDDGRKIKFTHNFGDLADREYQSRFWLE